MYFFFVHKKKCRKCMYMYVHKPLPSAPVTASTHTDILLVTRESVNAEKNIHLWLQYTSLFLFPVDSREECRDECRDDETYAMRMSFFLFFPFIWRWFGRVDAVTQPVGCVPIEFPLMFQ